MKNKRGGGAFAAMLWSVAAVSGEVAAAAPAEQDYLADLPVVLSVSRLAQPLGDAPGAVTVIDRETIRASGAREIAELLRLVPGFVIARAPQAPYAAAYHGMASDFPRRMQVLVDGRSQYSPFYVGGVNWSLMPVALEDIERIEVMRGSNSAAFGSNAFLGVINIRTRSGADSPGYTVAANHGQQNLDDQLVRGAWSTGNASLRATAENRRENGYDGVFDGRAKRLLDLRGDFRLSTRDEITLSFGALEHLQDNGVGTAAQPRRTEKNSNDYFQLDWRRSLDDNQDVAVRFSRSHEAGASVFAFSGTLPVVGPQIVPVDYGFHSWRHEIEAQHTFAPWTDARLVWGGTLRADRVYSPFFFGTRNSLGQHVGRLFGNLEWRFAPDWLANFGASAEKDSQSGSSFAPRLTLHFHPVPGHTLRVGASRAYRTPSIIEAHANAAFVSRTGIVVDRVFLAQNSPRPESIVSREIGYVADLRNFGLQVDARAFDESVAGRIQDEARALPRPLCEFPFPFVANCGVANDFPNAENLRMRGLEYQVRWQPAEATRLTLNQSFVHLAQQVLSFPGALTPTDLAKMRAQSLASSPTHMTSLMLMQRLPWGFDLGAGYHWIGAAKWSRNGYASAYQRFDWRLAYSFKSGGKSGEVAITTRSESPVHGEHDDGELIRRRGFITLKLGF